MKFILLPSLLILFATLTSAFVHKFSTLKTATRVRCFSLNMGLKVIVNDDQEPVENIIKKFKKACNQSGHLMDLRFKEQWETAAEKKKRKATKARLLNRIERTNDKYEKRAFGVGEYNS